MSSLRKDDPVKLCLEPFHAVFLHETVSESDAGSLELAVSHAEARSGQMHIEVHPVNASAGVVLDAQVDVLADAETEAAVFGEHTLPQLVLLHFQTLFQDL